LGLRLPRFARNDRERNPMPQKCYVLPEKLATPQEGIDVLIHGQEKRIAGVLWFFWIGF